MCVMGSVQYTQSAEQTFVNARSMYCMDVADLEVHVWCIVSVRP